MFYRRNTAVLEDSNVPVDYPWKPRSLYFFRRLYDRYLKLQGRPAALAQWPNRRSLAGGRAYFLGFFRTERRLLRPFANYLFLNKYNNLRRNLIGVGVPFLRFISINYRRNPWVPLCFNQYDQFDYHT